MGGTPPIGEASVPLNLSGISISKRKSVGKVGREPPDLKPVENGRSSTLCEAGNPSIYSGVVHPVYSCLRKEAPGSFRLHKRSCGQFVGESGQYQFPDGFAYSFERVVLIYPLIFVSGGDAYVTI